MQLDSRMAGVASGAAGRLMVLAELYRMAGVAS